MSDRKVSEDIQEEGVDPRTPKYYADLRAAGWTEEKIEKARARLKMWGTDDTFTDFFVHEARNALTPLVAVDENGLPIRPLGPENYSHSRDIFLKVRRGLDWYKFEGSLPKDKITSFLDKIEEMGEWNHERAVQINTEFKALIGPD